MIASHTVTTHGSLSHANEVRGGPTASAPLSGAGGTGFGGPEDESVSRNQLPAGIQHEARTSNERTFAQTCGPVARVATFPLTKGTLPASCMC